MKKIHTFCDLPLVLASAFYLIVISALGIGAIVLAPSYTVPSDVFGVQCYWGVLLILLYISMVIASKRILTFVTFDSECITFWTPFVRSQTCEYKQYTHIYPGSYFHGNIFGLGRQVSYVVFSQKYLSDEILANINKLANSPETFKIRMRHKRFEELSKLLPPYQAKMLQSAVKQRKK